MKLLTGKRVGQSGGELSAAILFSSIFHVIFFSAVLLLAVQGPLRKVAPPSYRVKLVDLPPDIANLPPTMAEPAGQPAPPAPPAPAPKPQPAPKAKAPVKTAPKAAAPKPSAVSKDAIPELDARKTDKKTAEQPAEARSGETAKKQESVAVASTTSEFKFPPYLAIVRDKVERNWNPPPGAKGAKVKVTFRVLRSGRVGEAKLQDSSGNFYFDQAAMRAILASSPFPPLPEGFFKEYETFSVDLMEKE
jgi:TonB family protein